MPPLHIDCFQAGAERMDWGKLGWGRKKESPGAEIESTGGIGILLAQ